MEFNPYFALINLAEYLLIVLLTRKVFCYPYTLSFSNRKLLYLLIVFFCMFSWWGFDYYGYQKEYFALTNDYNCNLEEVYRWIANNIAPNYIVFRLEIWGTGLLLFYLAVKRLNLPIDLAMSVFALLYMPWFSFSRTSLAITMMFYGLALVYKPLMKLSKISQIIGLAIIFASVYFHKSAAWGIACILLAMVIRPLGKKGLTSMLILFPLIVFIIKYVIMQYLGVDFDDNENGLNLATGQRYLARDVKESGIGTFIQYRSYEFLYLPVAYLALQFTRNVGYSIARRHFEIFGVATFVMTVLTFVFIFDIGQNTSLVFFRFCNFIMIPATIVITYFFVEGYERAKLKLIINIGILSQVYNILYSFYNMLYY